MAQTALTRRWGAQMIAMVLLCALYVATAKVGLELDAVSGFATLVWPPTGIGLAALVVFGLRLWPAIAVGAFVVNLTAGAPLAVAIGMAVGNTLEAVVGALLLERLRLEPAMGRVRDVVALALGAAFASTLLSATMGVASLWAGGVIDREAVTPTWRAWWIGDALGDLIVAPLCFVWLRAPRGRLSAGRIVEGLSLVALTALTSLYVFDAIFPRGPTPEEFRSQYLVFPVLIWAALRFRQLGAATCTAVVWIVAIAVTVLGFGPFATPKLSESLLPLQLFMGVVALATLFLAVAVSERDRAISARDEFLAVASHELRTPLAALDLQISNLRDLVEAGALPEDKLRAKLNVLERQGDRLGTLVANLLDVSRILAGRIELTSESLDVAAVIGDVALRFRDQAMKAGCELVVDVGELPPIASDRMRLEQVATNLIGNALKYGAGKPIEISCSASETAITLTVRDHGAGIALSDQARIFERFERAGAKRPAGGLGLGLWIVRQIVLAMGGSVGLASEPGQGAAFTVTIPRTPPQPRAA